MDAMEILRDRERRQYWLEQALQSRRVVVTLRANYPGQKKNNETTRHLLDVFDRELRRLFPVTHSDRWEGADGMTLLYQGDGEASEWKRQLIELEDRHPIGRFVDLDVYDGTLQPLSRKDFGYSPRRCFLCDRMAHDCVRNKRHLLSEVIAYIESEVRRYVSSQRTD